MGDDTSSGTAMQYRGPSGAFRDSKWLTQEDLPEGKDVVVEIEDVLLRKNVVFQGGRKLPQSGWLKFNGFERELRVNAGHKKILNRLYGKLVGGWIGKKVTLYVDPNVSVGGEIVGGVRMRTEAPK